MQHSSSLPVLMKPYLASPAAIVAKPLPPLSDTCSPLNIPSDGSSLPSLHPCLSPSVLLSMDGGAPFLRPRSKSFSVYEDEQAAAQQRGRISARLPAVRTARIAERPAVHVIHDARGRDEQPLVEATEEEEAKAAAQLDDGDESGDEETATDALDDYSTSAVNPLLSPIVEVDKEFFAL